MAYTRLSDFDIGPQLQDTSFRGKKTARLAIRYRARVQPDGPSVDHLIDFSKWLMQKSLSGSLSDGISDCGCILKCRSGGCSSPPSDGSWLCWLAGSLAMLACWIAGYAGYAGYTGYTGYTGC
ncbi:hypothetical protein Vi05172_g10039 [Venturia inaequalis]|nr:hypothetical protein Vi05172_g10039 [Venturia inaequalis]